MKADLLRKEGQHLHREVACGIRAWNDVIDPAMLGLDRRVFPIAFMSSIGQKESNLFLAGSRCVGHSDSGPRLVGILIPHDPTEIGKDRVGRTEEDHRRSVGMILALRMSGLRLLFADVKRFAAGRTAELVFRRRLLTRNLLRALLRTCSRKLSMISSSGTMPAQ